MSLNWSMCVYNGSILLKLNLPPLTTSTRSQDTFSPNSDALHARVFLPPQDFSDFVVWTRISYLISPCSSFLIYKVGLIFTSTSWEFDEHLISEYTPSSSNGSQHMVSAQWLLVNPVMAPASWGTSEHLTGRSPFIGLGRMGRTSDSSAKQERGKQDRWRILHSCLHKKSSQGHGSQADFSCPLHSHGGKYSVHIPHR